MSIFNTKRFGLCISRRGIYFGCPRILDIYRSNGKWHFVR